MKDLKEEFHNIFGEVYILINNEFVKLGAVEDSMWEFICQNYVPVVKKQQNPIDIELNLSDLEKIKFD